MNNKSESYNITFDRIIESIAAPLFIKDANCRYSGCNKLFEELIGLERDKIIGKTVYEISPGEQALIYDEADRNLLKSREKQLYEADVVISDGSKKRVEFHKSVFYDKDGNVEGIVGIILDITDRKNAETGLLSLVKDLEESEEKFYKLFENTPVVITVTDFETGKYLDVNRSFTCEMGYSKEEVLGKTSAEIGVFKAIDMRESLIKELKEKGIVKNIECQFVTKSGDILDANVSITIISINNRKCLLSSVLNITTHKRILEKLTQSEELYRLITENTSDVIWVYNITNEAFTFISPSITKLRGFTVEEALKQKISEALSPVSLVEFNKLLPVYISQFIKAPHSNHEYIHYVLQPCKDGSQVWVEVSVRFRLNTKNEIEVIGVSRNINERKAYEEKILNSEKKFRELFEYNTDGIAIFNVKPDGSTSDFCECNDNAAKMLGYTREEFLSISPLKLEVPVPKELLEKRIDDLRSKGKSIFETKLLHKKGNIIEVEMKSILIEYNGMPSIMNISRDITERKKAEEILINSREKAIEKDNLKSLFLANVSHEIRTPLNSLIGFSNMLTESEVSNEEKEQFISIIKSSGDQLTTIINDLIDITKIEANEITLMNSQICINEVIYEVIYQAEKGNNNKSIKYLHKVGLPDMDSNIEVDGIRLRQVLNNLISNAIKYTSQGEIIVGYELKNNFLVFFVKDSGTGIPVEFHNMIFERYRQVNSGDKTKKAGFGLGLSISKYLIEKMGGEIWLTSEPGQGSCFFFTIPANLKIEEKKSERVNSENPTEPSVLIVDDELYNYIYIKEILIKKGYKIYYASDGTEAVELVNTNPEIGFVLMDLRMPVMDGFTAAREIKKINKKILIVAQTAFAIANVTKEIEDAGFDGYITKPILRDDLFEIFKRFNY